MKQWSNWATRSIIMIYFLMYGASMHACPTCVGREANKREPFFSDTYYQPHSSNSRQATHHSASSQEAQDRENNKNQTQATDQHRAAQKGNNNE